MDLKQLMFEDIVNPRNGRVKIRTVTVKYSPLMFGFQICLLSVGTLALLDALITTRSDPKWWVTIVGLVLVPFAWRGLLSFYHQPTVIDVDGDTVYIRCFDGREFHFDRAELRFQERGFQRNKYLYDSAGKRLFELWYMLPHLKELAEVLPAYMGME